MGTPPPEPIERGGVRRRGVAPRSGLGLVGLALARVALAVVVLAGLGLTVGAPAAEAQAPSGTNGPASRLHADAPVMPRVDAVAVRDGVFYVRLDNSLDAIFDTVFDPATEELRDGSLGGAVAASINPVWRSCVPADPDVCYRPVRDKLAIQETLDGGATWTTAWEVSERDRELLALQYYAMNVESSDLSISSVAVAASPDGYVVLAGAEYDGLVMRHEDGTWERIGFANGRVPELGADPTLWKPVPQVWAFGAFCVLLVVCGEARGLRRRNFVRVTFGWLLSAFGLLVAYEVMGTNNVGTPGDTWPDEPFWVSVSAAIALVLTLLGVALAGGADGALYVRALALALVGSMAVSRAATFAIGEGPPSESAGWIAVAVGGGCAIIGALLMRPGGRPTPRANYPGMPA